jgi:hypothetical protein
MLDQIERYNEQYNAHNLVDAERALEHMWDFEQRWSHGSPLGVLDRVPVAIKDLIFLTARGILPWSRRTRSWARVPACGSPMTWTGYRVGVAGFMPT